MHKFLDFIDRNTLALSFAGIVGTLALILRLQTEPISEIAIHILGIIGCLVAVLAMALSDSIFLYAAIMFAFGFVVGRNIQRAIELKRRKKILLWISLILLNFILAYLVFQFLDGGNWKVEVGPN